MTELKIMSKKTVTMAIQILETMKLKKGMKWLYSRVMTTIGMKIRKGKKAHKKGKLTH